MRYLNWYRIFELLIYAICIVAILNLIIAKANAQPLPVACTHDMFAGCGKGGTVPFTYTKKTGEVITIKYQRLIGCLKPGLPACTLSRNPRLVFEELDNDRIAGLGAEHNYMVVGILTRASLEVGQQATLYQHYQKLLGRKCLLLNTSCGGEIAATYNNVIAYSVEWAAVENTEWWVIKPPTLKSYAVHAKLGAFGADGNPRTPDTGIDQFINLRDFLKYVAIPQIKKEVCTVYRKKYRNFDCSKL